MIFAGVSIFLWQLRTALSSEMDGQKVRQFYEQHAALKLSKVFVKVADGPVPYNFTRGVQNIWEDCVLCQLLEEGSQRGLPRIGWQYLYGRQPEKEAERALERITRLGLQGYILDAEQEYKTAGVKAVEVFMKRLREGSTVPVALCSYRFPSLHREFPWKAFAAWLDAEKGDCVMPQVYWVGDRRENGPALQLQRCVSEYHALKALPLVPIGGLYPQTVNGARWQPSLIQMQQFVQTAHQLKCPGMGWWSWDSVCRWQGGPLENPVLPEIWQEIQHTARVWNQPEISEEKLSLETRLAVLEEEARRHGWKTAAAEGGRG